MALEGSENFAEADKEQIRWIMMMDSVDQEVIRQAVRLGSPMLEK